MKTTIAGLFVLLALLAACGCRSPNAPHGRSPHGLAAIAMIDSVGITGPRGTPDDVCDPDDASDRPGIGFSFLDDAGKDRSLESPKGKDGWELWLTLDPQTPFDPAPPEAIPFRVKPGSALERLLLSGISHEIDSGQYTDPEGVELLRCLLKRHGWESGTP